MPALDRSSSPPAAPRRPTVLEAHGDRRVDDWYWLRERDDPEVTAHLEAENAHTEAVMAPTKALQDELFEEIRGRIQETDLSVPVRRKGWWYYTRTVEGLQYRIHCRLAAGTGEAASTPPVVDAVVRDPAEQVLLDENVLAEGHDYFALGGFAMSPDQTLLAYATDVNGGEKYTLKVRDLVTGDDLADVVEGVYYGLAWAGTTDADRTVFYTRPDEAMRPWQVWRHTLGTPVEDDVCVHTEHDDRFYVGIGRTRTEALLVLGIDSKVTSEVRVLQADDPFGEFRVVEPRRQGIEYGIEHHTSPELGERLLIVTNDEAEDFRLMVAPLADPGRSNWTELVPHRPGVRLEGVDAFASHLAVYEREEGLERIRITEPDASGGHVIEQPEPVYSAGPSANPEYETTVLRFGYTSMVTPGSVFDYDIATRTRTLLKQQQVLGGYDPSQYVTERLWATADDGTRVPMSIVHRRDLERPAPLLLYGYGSYEASMDPGFSSLRLSLLDRGFAFAIAHVRGGGELGRRWYEEGKLDRKVNTFTDFVACAEHLVAEGWTRPDRMVARGGSAGGLLMGAVTNLRPDLWRAVVAEVPFVDCLTTILDETLPLTVLEWEEWGNPKADAHIYEYMKSYSPYDNVQAKDYPAILATAGLNDPRVSYWEPAKWVQKLRSLRTDGRTLLLKTEMGAGHMGPSGRYDAWRDEAFVFAFVLSEVGERAEAASGSQRPDPVGKLVGSQEPRRS